jgi:hypothetical protein
MYRACRALHRDVLQELSFRRPSALGLQASDIVVISETFSMFCIPPSCHHAIGKPVICHLAYNTVSMMKGRDFLKSDDPPVKRSVGSLLPGMNIQ